MRTTRHHYTKQNSTKMEVLNCTKLATLFFILNQATQARAFVVLPARQPNRQLLPSFHPVCDVSRACVIQVVSLHVSNAHSFKSYGRGTAGSRLDKTWRGSSHVACSTV